MTDTFLLLTAFPVLAVLVLWAIAAVCGTDAGDAGSGGQGPGGGSGGGWTAPHRPGGGAASPGPHTSRGNETEPAWWPEFERQFRLYVSERSLSQ